MSVLVETTLFDATPLFVAKDKIIAFHARKTNCHQTVIYLSDGSHCEGWHIEESVESFRVKYDNA